MGSGSENHVRLDLPASAAKLGEAELKYSEKEKVIVIVTVIYVIESQKKSCLLSIFLQHGFTA